VVASFPSDATQASGEQEIEWKTYHDYEHGWSIEYPSGWIVKVDDSIWSMKTTSFWHGGITVIVRIDELPRRISISAEEHAKLWEETLTMTVVESEGYIMDRISRKKVNSETVGIIEDREYVIKDHRGRVVEKCRGIFFIYDKRGYSIFLSVHIPSVFNSVNDMYFERMLTSFRVGVEELPQ
jgi:hypothetical protein